MSLIKSEEDTLLHSTSVSALFEDQPSHSDCSCSGLIHEVRERVSLIVSTLKQEKEEFVEATNKQISKINEQTEANLQSKDLIIQSLENQIYKLIAAKNQMKRTFDNTVEKKNQEIQLLKEYVRKDPRKVESYKLLSPKTKDSSFRKWTSKQIYSGKESCHLEGDAKFSNTPTNPSMTSLSRKSSIPMYTPLKGLVSPKYLARSQNVKSALDIISRVNGKQQKPKLF